MKRIEDSEHFSLIRMGDGEFACIFGKSGETCDGQPYLPELSLELQRILLSPHSYPFHYGMIKIATKLYNEEINRYILENNANDTWCEGTVFVNASRAGKLFSLIHALRYKKVVYVGPSHLRKINMIGIPYEYFVEVPEKNAWLRRDTVTALIKAAVKTINPDVICFSAGPLTKVLIYDLYELYRNSLTMLDIGSLFDPFVGKESRKYMKLKTFKKLHKRNLGL
ncbi:hypothetical protein LCGC14_0645340 [marine sediment metagenome]|uniref:Glycosyltransferase GT-D fold domain-containing protein n=1 Tax=marine sediment metagenome TaxID=412755 RepID=A0A0F9U693_9ZZZZ